MKKIAYVLVGLILCLAMSCSSSASKKQENVRVLMKDSAETNVPQKMPTTEFKTNFVHKGKEYTSLITRQPDEEQPFIKNQQGDVFVDNSITLRITSANKTIVNKTFTKKDFASIIDSRFMKHAILEGLIYDGTTPEGFVYIASVSYPQSDLYVPIKLTIGTEGNIRMTKEELLENQTTENTDE